MKHVINKYKKFEKYYIDNKEAIPSEDLLNDEVTLDMAKRWVDGDIIFFDDSLDADECVEDMLFDMDKYFIHDREKKYDENELIEYIKKVWNEKFGQNKVT